MPTGAFRGTLDQFDYVEEEWFASGEIEGHPYATSLTVRRPRDSSRFSGTVMVEPVHAASAAPVWIYTSTYQMRAGHAWAAVCSQKTVLDGFVKPTNAERYASLDIWSGATSRDVGHRGDAGAPRPRRIPGPHGADASGQLPVDAYFSPGRSGAGERRRALRRARRARSRTDRPLPDRRRGDRLHPERSQRPAPRKRTPIYSGFFPSGAPSVRFEHIDVPIVQVLSDGDIADPNRAGREGRPYRRDDSDDPADRYRLYELAGVGHMGTRYPPYNDNAMWQNDPLGTAGRVPPGAAMNSLPHDELFSMGLHHLVQWVSTGAIPPRADRIEVGPSGFFAKDECSNSQGGVRCAQMDVPRLRYYSNPGEQEDGTPAFGVVGIEERLPAEQLGRLYRDHADYVDRFSLRLDELVEEGWFLAEDSEEMRAEAKAAAVP